MTTTAIKNDVVREPRRSKGLAASAVPMLERVWIVYGRISRTDPKDGGGASVKIDDQISQGTEYVLERDPEANILELRDNKSAFDPTVTREGFEKAMQLIKEGRVAGIVGWHIDRLSRQPLQIELLWAACEQQGTQLHTLKSGHISDPTMMRFESNMADRESRLKSDRIYDHHHRLAVDGRPHGGRRRFGYLDPMTAGLYEPEAKVIRECVRDLLAGTALEVLAKRLNEEGIKPPHSAQWKGGNLGKMLKGHHLAARRIYHGKDVGQAAWEPILTMDQHLRVKALLEAPDRRTTSQSGKGVLHLLPGIAVCGLCGATMRTAGGGPKKKPGYVCSAVAHVRRAILDADRTVSQFTVARLTDLNERGLLPDDAAAQEVTRLTDYIRARESFKASQRSLYAQQRLELGEYEAIKTEVAEDIKKARAKLTVAEAQLANPLGVLKGMTGPGAAAAWEKADLTRKRAILRVLWESITIQKAAHSRAVWDEEKDVVLEPRIYTAG
jgi:site-specific DNA recombinase